MLVHLALLFGISLRLQHQSVHWIGIHVQVIFRSFLLLVLLDLFFRKCWFTFQSFHQVFFYFDLNQLGLTDPTTLLYELSNVLLFLLLVHLSDAYRMLFALLLVLLEANPDLLCLAKLMIDLCDLE